MNKRPNIVFIQSDDQGAWALGCAGNHEIHTPNLDALAAQGLRFENFFCASPVCSPARASILTGTIPSAHGVLDFLRGGNLDMDAHAYVADDPVLRTLYKEERGPLRYLDGYTAYTDILKRNGYATALSGKWHLGDSTVPQNGFDRWFALVRGGCDYYKADFAQDGIVRHIEGYVTDIITDNALKDIDELSREEAPFYVSVHYTAPHNPWGAEHHSPELLDLYKDCPFDTIPNIGIHPWQDSVFVGRGEEQRREFLQGYFAATTSMDQNIGRIIALLKERGLCENTLVIFTSDNGMNMGHHGIWGKGNGTFPQNLFDTSVKVPFIASWPEQIQPGVCDALTSHYDIFPTLLDLLNLDGIETIAQPLVGQSFAGLLTGGGAESNECVVVFDEYGPVRMIRTKRHKYIHRYPYGPHEFYDLQDDPGEECNLLDERGVGSPEVETLKAGLKHQMEHWFNQHAIPEFDGVKTPANGRGQLRKAGDHAMGLPVYAEEELYYTGKKAKA